tara:strand:- start:1152 stop:1394 length:243 start_codon:yes stop_codon:yes gene_type:complete
MCIGNIFGGRPSRVYIPPPPRANPAIAERSASDRARGLEDQAKASQARKKQLQAGLGRRSLLSSTSGGYLSNSSSDSRLG